VLCGDIHKRAIVNIENVIEVDEEYIDYYLKNGWEKI
jgi:hypothetical protein